MIDVVDSPSIYIHLDLPTHYPRILSLDEFLFGSDSSRTWTKLISLPKFNKPMEADVQLVVVIVVQIVYRP